MIKGSKQDFQENLKLIKTYLLNACVAIETILASNLCVKKLENTKEGNVFNLIKNAIHIYAIVELRKILEPDKEDKTANLAYIIKYIEDNKSNLITKQHDLLQTVYVMEDTQSLSSESIAEFQKRNADREIQQYIKNINNLEKAWKYFYSKHSLYTQKIKESRDLLVHSIPMYTVTVPSIRTTKRIIKLIAWFIKKCDLILNNNTTLYNQISEETLEITRNFWSRFQ